MTQAQWNLLAISPAVLARVAEDPIPAIYSDVLAQFAAWNPITWSNAVVSLHIVYGWMPTIPAFSRPAGLTEAQRQNVVNLLNDARQRMLTAEELSILKTSLCNNSMVGTSKLLHFIAPERFPIWDSRVAKVWYAPQRAYAYTYEQPEEYLHYTHQVQEWASSPGTDDARAGLRAAFPQLETVSDVRLIEIPLFHASA